MAYENLFRSVAVAGKSLLSVSADTINTILLSLATETEKNISSLLEANRKDLELMDPADPKYDRLRLTDERIEAIVSDIRNVAGLPSPLGKILEQREMPNGLEISRVAVPFGVIGIIYEARPNVTFDVFSLCLKSGNACILKGGSDAHHSNEAIIKIIGSVLEDHGLSSSICVLLPPGHEVTAEMLTARKYIDLIIPRGSKGLIDYVVSNATIPVIETGAGIVHTYLDSQADIKLASDVINNAKTRRVSVCNALDCLVVHAGQLENLAQVVAPMAVNDVIIYADEPSFAALSGHYPASLLAKATPESFGTEFLSYKMSVKTVGSIDEALEHIGRYSSKHSEAIISTIPENIERFLHDTDASSVYVNTSTAFTDGAQFGLGAEIGISTQKLHARGPMGLKELTTYKWIVRGKGQIRP